MPRTRRKTQGVAVPAGVPYGQGVALADSQRQIPLPGPTPTPAPSHPASGPAAAPADPMAAALAAAATMAPPQSGGLTAPTRRPAEPVTAGLPTGPGPGPEALPLPVVPEDDAVLQDLINAYRLHPTRGLQQLIDVMRARSSARQRTLDAGRRR